MVIDRCCTVNLPVRDSDFFEGAQRLRDVLGVHRGIGGTRGGIRGERWKRRGVAGADVEERWGDGVGVRAREDILALYLRVYRTVRTSVSTPVARVSGRVEKGGRGCESGKI